ncbi:melanocortin receptor 5-like [Stylophora pistillata]|uniref:melanocortin receptor 5-like n=1 Tax=Stylophora pistillata TaxID=50429 RepID=UPI000C056553|nr:melanocortin receptor 5-like [Stylophora pistillata]
MAEPPKLSGTVFINSRSFKLATHKPSENSMANKIIKCTNNDTNVETRLPLPESNCIPWVVVFSTESLAIVILNIVTIIIFLKKRQLQRRSAILIIHLAIVDLLVGAVSGPLDNYWIGSVCKLWKYGANFVILNFISNNFVFSSLLNIVAISLEQFLLRFSSRYAINRQSVIRTVIAIKIIGQVTNSSENSMPDDAINRTHDDTSSSPILESGCIPWVVVFITECLAIVILNIINIIVFVKQRQLKRRSTYLIIHLAIVDLLVGAVSGPIYIYWFGRFCDLWELGLTSEDYKALRIALVQNFLFVSLLNLAAISLERVHATFCPFRHRLIKTWVYGVVVIVIWVTNIAAALTERATSGPIVYFPSFLFLLFIISVSYTSIFIKVHLIRSLPRHGAVAARERKLTRVLFIVTLASLFMWFPSGIATGIAIIHPNLIHNSFWSTHFRIIMVALNLANSLLNPIIYAMRMPELRQGIKQIIFRRTPNRLNPGDIPLRDF